MRWIKWMLIASTTLTMTACSTSQDATLPQPTTQVKDVWESQTGASGSDAVTRQRSILRQPLSPTAIAQRQSDYSRDSYREVFTQFSRLPNPDIVLFVFPHKTGAMPVPGYSTVFPLYERVQYAMPGDAFETMPYPQGAR
ncbi:TIGR03751 family conjugal transfer lipoprotein [Photobacterium leiognathi]|uniref:TIGR03751 family conjugal transfer lipoprotein n=1 Tax=Photobacterium leiognathi TaxID=553611 RepID=UPI002981573F|nr:TIGR03751 family conjugal transfer lipoprotein [Photobacterium leiognathi]